MAGLYARTMTLEPPATSETSETGARLQPPAEQWLNLSGAPEVIAPQLLGAVLRLRLRRSPFPGTVAIKLTEVEAYPGAGDPASHTFHGITPRCATMFGPPGHLYVYASYGIHRAGNIVCRESGVGAGILLRAGRVIEGIELARQRRTRTQLQTGTVVVPDDDALARGPGNLGATLGLDLDLDGTPLSLYPSNSDDPNPADGPRKTTSPDDPATAEITLSPALSPVTVVRGPRIGISKNREAPLRFWIPGDRSVSSPRREP